MSVGGFVKWLLGVDAPPPEVVARRLDLCNGCPQLGRNRRCSLCGCPVDHKARVRSERCPLRLW